MYQAFMHHALHVLDASAPNRLVAYGQVMAILSKKFQPHILQWQLGRTSWPFNDVTRKDVEGFGFWGSIGFDSILCILG